MRHGAALKSLVWIYPRETVTYSVLNVAEPFPEFGVGYRVEHASPPPSWDRAISALRRMPLAPGRSMAVQP